MRLKSTIQQRGSALVVAIFVIVVLGLLVSVLSRLVSTSSDSVAIEVLGERAFNAAQSGIQATLLELYPLGSFAGCNDGESFTYDYSGGPEGLRQCKAVVTCKVFNAAEDSDYQPALATHYQLLSVGSCDAGSTKVSRQVAVESRNSQ